MVSRSAKPNDLPRHGLDGHSFDPHLVCNLCGLTYRALSRAPSICSAATPEQIEAQQARRRDIYYVAEHEADRKMRAAR